MRLPASLRAAFYAAAGLLLASGIAWLAMHYELLPAGEAGSGLMLKLHGAAAMAVLFLSGSVAALHAPRAWRERRNRASGALLATLLAALTLTACLLYYAGGDAIRESASVAHWLAGIGAAGFVWLHAFLGRR